MWCNLRRKPFNICEASQSYGENTHTHTTNTNSLSSAVPALNLRSGRFCSGLGCLGLNCNGSRIREGLSAGYHSRRIIAATMFAKQGEGSSSQSFLALRHWLLDAWL